MARSSPLALVVLALVAGCRQADPPPGAPPPRDHAPAPAAPAPPPVGPVDCGALVGANPVQTEMRQLECMLQRAVVAIGRDDLPSIAAMIHVVHEAKEATSAAIEGGGWRPARGDVAAFVALDDAFHRELEALYHAATARDHAAAGAAIGRALARCHGCHAAFRDPPGATPPPAPSPHGHD